MQIYIFTHMIKQMQRTQRCISHTKYHNECCILNILYIFPHYVYFEPLNFLLMCINIPNLFFEIL